MLSNFFACRLLLKLLQAGRTPLELLAAAATPAPAPASGDAVAVPAETAAAAAVTSVEQLALACYNAYQVAWDVAGRWPLGPLFSCITAGQPLVRWCGAAMLAAGLQLGDGAAQQLLMQRLSTEERAACQSR
jgi:hypothetical protein